MSATSLELKITELKKENRKLGARIYVFNQEKQVLLKKIKMTPPDESNKITSLKEEISNIQSKISPDMNTKLSNGRKIYKLSLQIIQMSIDSKTASSSKRKTKKKKYRQKTKKKYKIKTKKKSKRN